LNWTETTVDAPQLADGAQARLRFHFTSDVGVVADGIHVDDSVLSCTPIVCNWHLLYLSITLKN